MKTPEGCEGCRFFDYPHCKKWEKEGKCDISSLEWFNEPFDFVKINRVCCEGSVFGNYHIGITQSDIDRLKKGEIIHIGDEYGIFIGYKHPDETIDGNPHGLILRR